MFTLEIEIQFHILSHPGESLIVSLFHFIKRAQSGRLLPGPFLRTRINLNQSMDK